MTFPTRKSRGRIPKGSRLGIARKRESTSEVGLTGQCKRNLRLKLDVNIRVKAAPVRTNIAHKNRIAFKMAVLAVILH